MNRFAEKLITWYEVNQRNLPWRETKDPYKIWISEIILQQTRVAQGYDYYCRFIQRFPDVFSLAEADEDEILARIGVLFAGTQSARGCPFHSRDGKIPGNL